MIETQRQRVAAQARTWLGTPYHHHARIKGVGVDCAQLLCAVFEACGLIPHVETGHYPVDWHLHRSEQVFSAWLGKFAQPASGPYLQGDVCLFQFGRTFSHGSICVGDDLFVHSYIKGGVMLSRLTDEPLCGRNVQHWSCWV